MSVQTFIPADTPPSITNSWPIHGTRKVSHGIGFESGRSLELEGANLVWYGMVSLWKGVMCLFLS